MKKIIILAIAICLSGQLGSQNYFGLEEILRIILPVRHGETGGGFIYKGRISLRQVDSGNIDTFEYYMKSNRGYVKYCGRYYSLCRSIVTINDVKYFTSLVDLK